MMIINYTIIAFILDLIIGDPEYELHPVRLIGKQIHFFEKIFRKIFNSQYINGILFTVFIILIVIFEMIIIFITAKIFDFLIGFNIFVHISAIFFIYSSICLTDLKQKGLEIYQLLKDNNIKSAGKKLSMIVGRDTDNLNKLQIIKAVVETLSENIVDGVISPLFYALIGGPFLAMIYRTINTLDSMVGYKNDKYLLFGRSSALTDDLVNYIPARITGIIIPIAGFLCFNNMIRSFRIMLRDGQKHPSPNSGIAESAVAGAIGVQLGGASYYAGKKIEKPLIGDDLSKPEKSHIIDTVKIAYFTCIIFLAVGVIMKILIYKIIKLWIIE